MAVNSPTGPRWAITPLASSPAGSPWALSTFGRARRARPRQLRLGLHRASTAIRAGIPPCSLGSNYSNFRWDLGPGLSAAGRRSNGRSGTGNGARCVAHNWGSGRPRERHKSPFLVARHHGHREATRAQAGSVCVCVAGEGPDVQPQVPARRRSPVRWSTGWSPPDVRWAGRISYPASSHPAARHRAPVTWHRYTFPMRRATAWSRSATVVVRLKRQKISIE